MAWLVRRAVLGLVVGLSAGACGPDVNEAVGSLAGGSGGAGEVWAPEDDAEEADEPGPATLAMGYEADQARLVSLGPGGRFDPYGPLLPRVAEDVAFKILEWEPEVGRGALLRSSETTSNVVFIDHEALTVVHDGTPRVSWIQLSRDAKLVVLQHEDDSTTVVDRKGSVVLSIEPPGEGRQNWLGFGDGDRWVVWSRHVQPSNPLSDLDYWLHDFDTGRTRPLVNWPTGSGARIYTFSDSILRQHDDDEPDWIDLAGRSVATDLPLETLSFGPGRHVFAEGRAYRLREGGELEDLGPQVRPEGFIHRYEPGRYILVQSEDRAAYFDPEGRVLAELSLASAQDAWFSAVPKDPDDLSIVVSISYLLDGVSEQTAMMWRPEADGAGNVEFGFSDRDNRRTSRFAPDGSLVSLFEDESMTVVLPGAEDEEPLEPAYAIEGFHYAWE